MKSGVRGEGRGGVYGTCWKDGTCRFWYFAAGRKWRLVGRKGAPGEKNFNLQDQRIKARRLDVY